MGKRNLSESEDEEEEEDFAVGNDYGSALRAHVKAKQLSTNVEVITKARIKEDGEMV
jgi:phosphoribosylpyrophosphate synthetase